jgi:hypothetical protein
MITSLMKKFSPLELLHPDGSASTSVVLGSNCPESLFPPLTPQMERKVELFIIAPTATECKAPGWLDAAVGAADDYLSGDGLCYLLVPPPWRLKMLDLLSQTNLVIDSSFWHFPDCTSSQYLVPLQRAPAQYMVENIISAPSWKRLLALETFRYSIPRKVFGTFWKSVGICSRHQGARPLFQWLFQSKRERLSPGTAILRRSWRVNGGASLLYCFSKGESLPSVIAKTCFVESSVAFPEREAQILEKLGPHAHTPGVQIPQVLHKERNDHRSSLFLSSMTGRPASELLVLRPEMFSSVLTRLVDWLEHWHAATIQIRLPGVEEIERNFLDPLERLFPLLQNAGEYRNWLTERVRLAARTPTPFVATHNDLTMANVLVDEYGPLSVVDWETGLTESWPLVDFYYAVTDAVRIVQGNTKRLDAFKACYLPDGFYYSEVACWEGKLRSVLEMSPVMAELCFHACWLHHAVNEDQISRTGDLKPFLQIVQWLALNHALDAVKEN